MNSTDKIEESYFLAKDVFEQNESKIREDIQASICKMSWQAVYFSQKKIDLFLTAIAYLASLDSEAYFYAIQANMRLIYEHFLVGHYIWTKTRLSESDECGQHYYAHYRLSELLKQENYDLQVEGMELNLKQHATPENLVKRLEGAPIPISPRDIQEVHTLGRQFDVRVIINYLLNEVPADDQFNAVHRILPQFVRDYNRLSSFVHGGPSAEALAFEEVAKPVNKSVTVTDSLAFAKICSRVLKENLMLGLIPERNEYLNIVAPIMKLKKEKEEP
jgi:hypothetical protein